MSMSNAGARLVSKPVFSALHDSISLSLALVLVCQSLIAGALPLTGIGIKPACRSLRRHPARCWRGVMDAVIGPPRLAATHAATRARYLRPLVAPLSLSARCAARLSW